MTVKESSGVLLVIFLPPLLNIKVLLWIKSTHNNGKSFTRKYGVTVAPKLSHPRALLISMDPGV